MITPAEDERLIAAAMRLYAEHGFDVPLARIARAARISPAALRGRVGSAKALRQRALARLFGGRWKPAWDSLLADRSLPLGDRLSRFYAEYRGNIDRTGARLWTRAGLLGLHASGNFSVTLAARILIPIVRELRREAGMPGTARRSISGAEIEVAQMLHGAIAFPHTRSHIFGMRVHGRLDDLVAMMVRVWLPGAIAEIRRLHARRPARRAATRP
jgi:AcrR family transcriptional regulator